MENFKHIQYIFPVFLFDLIYLAESYSTYNNNKNIIRTDMYISYNKYHMYLLSKKPRITQKVVKLISIVVLKKTIKKSR